MDPSRHASTAECFSPESEFASLFRRLPVAPLGGRLRARPAIVSIDQIPRLHRKLLEPRTFAGEMALPQTQRSAACACHCDGAPRRSGDRAVDFADRCRGALRQATRIVDKRSGGEGRCAEKRMAGLRCNAPARHAVSGNSAEQECCEAWPLAEGCVPIRPLRDETVRPHLAQRY